ncbi:MAG: hypothetical protein U1E15_02595 [Hyphomicrobiales bacterium]
MSRKPFAALLSLSFVTFLSTPVLADTPLGIACRAYAAAVADDYMSDELVRIDDTVGAREGYLTAHVAGHKFLIPVNAPGEGGVQPRAIGTRV